jgi:hypothetical protein
MSLPAMPNTMHHHGGFLKIEEDPVVAAAQSIITIKVGQPFDVTVQPMFEP